MLIAHLTDLHIRPVGLPAYRTAETNALTERALEAVLALAPRPDVVVISGDLTDNGLVAEYENLKRLLARLPMPVWLIPGNHDRRENLKAVLADFPGLAQHDKYAQWATDLGPLRLIGLDTVIPGSGAGRLCPRRLEWLAERLAEDKAKPTVIVMHHPPFACGLQLMDNIMLVEGVDELAAIIRANSQVVRILCGHHHRPIQTMFAGTLAMIAPSVAHQVVLDMREGAQPAFNFEPAAFHLHYWSVETGLISHTAYVEKAAGPYPFLPDPDYPGRSREA
ncbi:phosphodiesterase [Phreatobacter stygius]|uniref:Phosphodiesterase n=1 Tax=Phreatobacter stygius TaxID=1940610 RepID=A0A4D7B3J2_9HYPH|nr:phosphodiesterase [Phreatobacter stygius]QCI68339.1 phosphodiesterase [Phreatobacter stygius]